jgi:hypothetical protein
MANIQVLIRFPIAIHTNSIIDILTNRSGANFGKTLVNYESHPSKDATQRHQALSRRWDTDQFKNVVVMFREPRQRLISSYYAIQRYHDTCCNLDWGLKALERKILVSKIVKGQSLGETITKYKGCVANMIIGYQCMDVQAPRLTATRMALARKRMSEFLFVGIQSHYELSMCLFNHIATGHKFILPEQQDPTTQNQTVPFITGFNTTTIINTNEIYNSSLLLPKNFVDGPDEQLYEYALSLFHKEISMRNISLESCRIVEVTPEPLFEWNYLVTSNDEPATASPPPLNVVVSPPKHTEYRMRPITAKASASKGVGVGKPPRSSTKPSLNTNTSNVQKKKKKTNSVNTTVLDDDGENDDDDDDSIVLRVIEGHKPFWLHIPK